MKKIIVISILFSLLGFGCKSKNGIENTQELVDTSLKKIKIIVDFEKPLQSKRMHLRLTDQPGTIYGSFELKDLTHFEEEVIFEKSQIFQLQFDQSYVPIVLSENEKSIVLKVNNLDANTLNYSVLHSLENTYFHSYLLRFSPNGNPDSKPKRMFLDSISPSFVAAEIYIYELNQFFDFYIEDIPKIKEKYQKIAYASKLINMISVKESEPIRIGGKIPNFTLPTADGKSISPQDFKGRYLLVDFWASWCGPCRNEVPNVAKAYAKYKSKGFEVLGISTDTDPEKWKSAIKQLNMTWTSVRDVKGEASQIFNIEFIPTVYLVGPDGTILADQVRGERLEELLKKYLGE